MWAISCLIKVAFRFKLGFIIVFLLIKMILLFSGKGLSKKLNDKYLELMLRFIDISFWFSRDYRKNIKNFSGKYVFKTRELGVSTYVIFKNGDMKVYDQEKDIPEKENWDIIIIFKDCKAMREALKSIILTGNFDLLDFMLEDKIETIGNINYAFKFMFLVNNLTQRIGIG